MGKPAAAFEIEPRCFTREQASAYCGLTPEGFAVWQARGIVPGPIGGTKRWDRRALDAALDRHSGLRNAEEPEDAFDTWKRNKDARKAAGGRERDQGAR